MQISTVTYLLAILASIQLTHSFISKSDSSEIDCSKYSDDEDILLHFPFDIETNVRNPSSTMTHAKMNDEHNLIHLKIAHQKCIPSLIFCFKHLSKLEIVNTGFCNFEQGIPSEIERFAPSLKVLEISNTKIVRLPNEISKLKFLEELKLSNVGLESLLDSIGNLTSLNSLILDNNNISQLPETIKDLTSLHQLILSNNPNLRLITQLNGHSNLQFLDTRDCQIQRLPLYLPELRALYMSNNQLKHLRGIHTLGYSTTQMKLFDFDRNRIGIVTYRIGLVPNLYRLNLEYNLLKALPDAITNIPSLSELYLKGNNITTRRLNNYISKLYATNPGLELSHD